MKFTLTKKIGLPFLIIVLLVASMGVVSLVGYHRADDSILEMRFEAKKQMAVATMQSTFASLLMAVNGYIITGNGKYRDDYAGYAKKLDAETENLLPLAKSAEERNALQNIQIRVGEVTDVARKVDLLPGLRSNPQASPLMQEMDYRYGGQVYNQMSAISELAEQRLTAASLTVEEERRWAIALLIVSTIIAVGIGTTVTVWTMRRISRPIRELVGIAQRIAARDFSVKLAAATGDEIGTLILAFNAMADEINRRYEDLENFANIVAHDLKGPLTNIIGTAEVLFTDFSERFQNEASGFLRDIVASGNRMSALIDDLLEFARAGRVKFAKDPVSMSDLLKEVQTDFALYLKERNAKLVVKGSLPTILCDPVRFSQVWKNLIANAIKYNDAPSPLVEIGCEPEFRDGAVYRFYVRDNGIGIPESERERIFMPFQRATQEPKYEGTGIGLAIVKLVVEFHGGRIWVESSLGHGTTFYFTVPKPKVV